MRLPKTAATLAGHRHRDSRAAGDAELPAALQGAHLGKGLMRLVVFAGLVVTLIIAAPGLGSIRNRLSHGDPGWLAVAGSLRLLSALSYVVLFRAIFAPTMSWRQSYRIGMTEIGLNALAPAGGASGLAVGDWVLHRQGVSWEQLLQRSAEFFVFTSAFNVGAVAVLGWLGAIGILAAHGSFALSAVPAAVATLGIVLALALAPALAGLQTRLSTQSKHGLRWWVLQLGAALGTGARGTLEVFRGRDWRAIIGGAGYLVFDMATLWATVRAMHGHIALQPLAMAYLIGQLAGEIPIPGGLGVVEGGLIGALALYGLSWPLATAGALAYRAIALGVPTLVGGAAAISLARAVRSERPGDDSLADESQMPAGVRAERPARSGEGLGDQGP